jgi:hypothetical protein
MMQMFIQVVASLLLAEDPRIDDSKLIPFFPTADAMPAAWVRLTCAQSVVSCVSGARK